MDEPALCALIEHTLLAPEATRADIETLCDEAVELGFHAVCVNPSRVGVAAARLAKIDSDRRPRIVSTAGFPLGASHAQTKAQEAARVLEEGADEVDMVIAIGALIDGDTRAVRAEIELVSSVVHARPNRLLKVILECGALSDEQIIAGCRCCMEGEADFVKTSTGLHRSAGGATVHHVSLLHRYASPMGVKASGGVRTLDAVLALAEAGATRIGTSSGASILRELRERSE